MSQRSGAAGGQARAEAGGAAPALHSVGKQNSWNPPDLDNVGYGCPRGTEPNLPEAETQAPGQTFGRVASMVEAGPPRTSFSPAQGDPWPGRGIIGEVGQLPLLSTTASSRHRERSETACLPQKGSRAGSVPCRMTCIWGACSLWMEPFLSGLAWEQHLVMAPQDRWQRPKQRLETPTQT